MAEGVEKLQLQGFTSVFERVFLNPHKDDRISVN